MSRKALPLFSVSLGADVRISCCNSGLRQMVRTRLWPKSLFSVRKKKVQGAVPSTVTILKEFDIVTGFLGVLRGRFRRRNGCCRSVSGRLGCALIHVTL